MKVLIARADNGGCGFYRALEPARVVSEQFPEVDVRVQSSADVEASRDPVTMNVTVHEIKEDIDVLVVQRPLKQDMIALLEQARRQGIATVVEIDDDLTTVHPSNIAYRQVHPKFSPRENYEWFRKAANDADLVTCTTAELCRFNESHALLPNYVPERFLSISGTPRDRLTVGWTGTLQVHPFDLGVTRGQIGKVLTGSGAGFFNVGDGERVPQALKLPHSVPFGCSGWLPLEDYPQAIADNIDIGIVPLEYSLFNQSKSSLKGLEMASLGIPFVATATEPYQRLADYGVGKLATDHSDFRNILRKWLNDPDLARADGKRYRDIVGENLTYEQHAASWVRAWSRAIDARKKAGK